MLGCFIFVCNAFSDIDADKEKKLNFFKMCIASWWYKINSILPVRYGSVSIVKSPTVLHSVVLCSW